MRRGQRTWKSWRERIVDRAEQLLGALGVTSPPVPLAAAIGSCHVDEVVFRPLPVAGAIAVKGNGFLMYVKCNKNDAQEWQAKLQDAGDEGRSLSVRARFTIAHELTHTFFFRLSDTAPEYLLSARQREDVAALEQACNLGAARLLLPEALLRRQADRDDLFDPAILRRLGREFHVSLDVLVTRLESCGAWGTEKGVAAVIREENGHLEIRAVARDGTARALFPKAKFGAGPETLIRDSGLIVYGGTDRELTLDVRAQVGPLAAHQRCVVACDQLYSKPRTYVMTVRLDGEPVLVPARKE